MASILAARKCEIFFLVSAWLLSVVYIAGPLILL